MTTRRSTIAVLAFAWLAVMGCGESSQPPDSDIPRPATSEGESTETHDFLLSYHDDPIVIDNAPVRVALGRRAQHANNHRQWSRVVHNWDYLAILRRDKNGNATSTKVAPMCPGDCTLVLGLVGIDEPSVSTNLTFTLRHGTDGRMAMADEKNRRFPPNGRWLEPRDLTNENNKENLRIRYVTAFNENNESIFEPLDFGADYDGEQVDIVLVTRE